MAGFCLPEVTDSLWNKAAAPGGHLAPQNKLFRNSESLNRNYPVPSNDWVNLKIPVDRGSVTITDMSGTIVLEQEINSTEAKVFVGDFSPGVYFMRLRVEEDVVFKKLIVK